MLACKVFPPSVQTMAKTPMTVSEMARLGGKAKSKKMSKAQRIAHGRKMALARHHPKTLVKPGK